MNAYDSFTRLCVILQKLSCSLGQIQSNETLRFIYNSGFIQIIYYYRQLSCKIAFFLLHLGHLIMLAHNVYTIILTIS